MRRLTLIAATLMLCACPPPTPDADGGGNGGPLTPEQAIARVLSAICSHNIQCFNETAAGARIKDFLLAVNPALVHILLDHNACTARLAQEFPITAVIATGRLAIDVSKVGACIAALQTKCFAPENENADCAGFLQPQVAIGGQCGGAKECQGDATCNAQTGQCGSCAARGAVGETCSDDDDCTSGAICDPRTNNCAAPTPGATGEACDGSLFYNLAGACTASDDLCVAGVCTKFTMHTTVGAACDPEGTATCGAGFYCLNGQCSNTFAAEAAACAEGDTRIALCAPGNHCRDGVCQNDASSGNACGDDVDTCSAALYCTGDDVCADKLAVGGACDDDDNCVSDECDRGSNQCVATYPTACG